MGLYSLAMRDKFVAAAVKAAEAHGAGKKTIKLGTGGTAQVLDLVTGGYCARFVRQVSETTFGLLPGHFLFAAASAREMGAKMHAADLGHDRSGNVVGTNPCPLRPGDVLVWEDADSGKYGHIAIYVGNIYGDGRKLVCENTSSGKRGCPTEPGTKMTQLRNMRPGWKAYRMFVEG